MGVSCYVRDMDIQPITGGERMNAQSIGQRIENHVKVRFNLIDSKIGFDGCSNSHEYEIKGCIPTHKNGVNRNGRDRITKGRFWIDNYAHRLLLKERGIYIFVLYIRVDKEIIVIRTRFMPAHEVQNLIKAGDNTKIRYDLIFQNHQVEVV